MTTTSPRSSGARHGEAAFVGRADEMNVLLGHFDTTLGGRSLTALVSGDAGIGKSRLVSEFADEARLRGAVVATGACVPGDGALPYAPVMGILRDLTRAPAPRRAAELLSVIAGEATGSSGDTSDASDASDLSVAATEVSGTDYRPDAAGFARTALFESIVQTVLDLAESAPVVIVVEDVHWCDLSSAQVLDYLARNAADSRVLLVCTARHEELIPGQPLATWLTELSRLPTTTSLEVGPLSRTNIATLLHERHDGRLDPSVVDSVWNRSQGNPFFAEQLAATAQTDGVPAQIQAVIQTRVRSLTPACQQLLALGAVAGPAFGHALVAKVDGADEATLLAAINEAIDNSIVTVDAERDGYRFRHALLREALYDSVLPARRRELHKQLASALTGDPSLGAPAISHRNAELAGHWWAAGERAAALVPSLAAADAAMDGFAFREALAHYDHALAAWEAATEPQVVTGITWLDLLERAAEAAFLSSESRRAGELGRAAVEEALRSGEVHSAARCYTLVGRIEWGLGDSDASFEAFRVGRELLDDQPSVELARLLAEEARSLLLMSQLQASRVKAQQALAVAETLGLRQVIGHARNTLGACIATEGDYAAGIALLREALEIAEDLNSPEDLNRAYTNLSSVLLECGRFEEAAAIVFDSLAMGDVVGGARLATAATNSIEALVHLGRWDDAEALRDQVGLAPYGSCAASPYVGRAPLALRRGRFDEAARLLQITHDITDGLRNVQFTALAHTLHAELEIERGNPGRAVELMRVAHKIAADGEEPMRLVEFMPTGVRAAADAAIAARHPDDGSRGQFIAAADEWLAAAEGAIATFGRAGHAVAPLSMGYLAVARAEHTRIERSDPNAWRHAAEVLECAPSAYFAAYARWREAEALLESRGSQARAHESLNAAWRGSTALRTVPLTERIEALAQRARIDLMATAPSDSAVDALPADFGLTARETEILGYLAIGTSDREIAERLFISKKTVSVHVSNILRKLQVTSRIQAGKIAQAHGVRPQA